MDGGSGLNIMYADTLKGMGIPMSKLSESSMQFHGVVPGRKAKSLGQIALDVVFGSDKNFRKEKLTFEVVDFQSAYHAILGRPTYARFMVRPCYVYLKLKMPAIADFDSKIVAPILKALEGRNDVVFAVLPDHPVPIKLRKHTTTPVPVAVCGPGIVPDEICHFSETAAPTGTLGHLHHDQLMKLVLHLQ